MELERALIIANNLLDQLRPYCDKVEVAGSVRRGLPEVHDIEIVCKPRVTDYKNLFGEPVYGYLLYEWLDQTSPNYQWGKRLKGGAKYREYTLPEGINLDLFIVVPPAHWGVIMTLRTGSADFSKWCVTPRRLGGGLPSSLMVTDGEVLHKASGKVVDMPEECDFLNLIDLGWVEPSERKPKW